MNQSSWFSLEDVELEHQISPANPLIIKERKLPQKLNMDQLLSQYKQLEINPNLIKYIVFENESAKNSKKFNLKSKIKRKCEERDLEGNLTNKGTNTIQATQISMVSSIPYIQGLRSAFLSMKEGDIAWFKLSNEQMYTEQEIEFRINKNISKLIYQKQLNLIYLLIQQVWRSNIFRYIESCLKQLELFKIEGNQFYEKQQYQSALLRYQRGLNFLEKWPQSLKIILLLLNQKETPCYQNNNKKIQILQV